jgi:Holliday junction resolvase-like predicted endonuclease
VRHTKHCDSRKGDMAEYYAVTWLWDNGYEVFKNCGCTGLADLIVRDSKGSLILIDVKTAQPQNKKGKNNNYTKCTGRTKEQVKAGVQLLMFEPHCRKLYFVNHRDKND